MKKNVISIVCLLLICSVTFAQNKVKTKSFRYFMSSVKPSKSYLDAESLIYGIDPTFKDGKIKIYTNTLISGEIKGLKNDGTDLSLGRSMETYKALPFREELVLSESLDSLSYNSAIFYDAANKGLIESAKAKSPDLKFTFNIDANSIKMSGYNGTTKLKLENEETNYKNDFPLLSPSFFSNSPRPRVYFDYKGVMSGFKMKDITSFPVFDSYTFSQAGGNYQKVVTTPFQPENEKLLNSLSSASPSVLYSHSKNDFHGLLSYNNPDDKFSTYKEYYFVQVDKNGKATLQDSLSFEFIRDNCFSQVVVNTKGEETGIMYVFKQANYPMGGKKQKDPVKNNFDIVMIGLDGKVKFNYKVQRGNDEYGMNPVMVFEKNGLVYMYNLRKDVWNDPGTGEILSFSNKEMKIIKEFPLPKMSNSEKETLIAQQAFLLKYSKFPTLKPILIGEQVVILSQVYNTIINTNPSTGREISRDEEYTGIAACSIGENLDTFNQYIFPLYSSKFPANVENISNDDKKPVLLLTTDKSNLIIAVKDNKLVKTDIIDGDRTKPKSALMYKNYIVDKAKNKIYFFMNSKEKNTGEIAVYEY